MPLTHFDPDAAARPGSGVFGLPLTRHDARIILVPVPFDATVSFGTGTARGPAAIRAASAQVDLHDMHFGPVFQRGIFMEDESPEIADLSRAARALAEPIILAGGTPPPGTDPAADSRAIAEVNAAGERVNTFTYEAFSRILGEGKTPGLVGGDHSTPFGAIRACAEYVTGHHDTVAPAMPAAGLGILHIDAHMDLRDSFEGFAWSHASIMHNVITHVPEVTRLVQIGLRDVGESEIHFANANKGRIFTHFDHDWSAQLLEGHHFSELCRLAIAHLPKHIYISFDIDGLDPALCPHTGTPVPGGLTYNQVCFLLKALRDSNRHLVGFDLVEVAPSPDPDAPEWDASVGARLLYKLCGLTTGE